MDWIVAGGAGCLLYFGCELARLVAAAGTTAPGAHVGVAAPEARVGVAAPAAPRAHRAANGRRLVIRPDRRLGGRRRLDPMAYSAAGSR